MHQSTHGFMIWWHYWEVCKFKQTRGHGTLRVCPACSLFLATRRWALPLHTCHQDVWSYHSLAATELAHQELKQTLCPLTHFSQAFDTTTRQLTWTAIGSCCSLRVRTETSESRAKKCRQLPPTSPGWAIPPGLPKTLKDGHRLLRSTPCPVSHSELSVNAVMCRSRSYICQQESQP